MIKTRLFSSVCEADIDYNLNVQHSQPTSQKNTILDHVQSTKNSYDPNMACNKTDNAKILKTIAHPKSSLILP